MTANFFTMQAGEAKEKESAGILPETMKHRMLILVNERVNQTELPQNNEQMSNANSLTDAISEAQKDLGIKNEQENNQQAPEKETIKSELNEAIAKVQKPIVSNDKQESNQNTQENKQNPNNEQIENIKAAEEKMASMVVLGNDSNKENEVVQNVEQTKEKIEDIIQNAPIEAENKPNAEEPETTQNSNDQKDNTESDNQINENKQNTEEKVEITESIEEAKEKIDKISNEIQIQDENENPEQINIDGNEEDKQKGQETVSDNQAEEVSAKETFDNGCNEIVNLISPDEQSKQPEDISSRDEGVQEDKVCSTSAPNEPVFVAQIDKPYVYNKTAPGPKKLTDEELAQAMHSYIVHKALPPPEERGDLYVYMGQKGFDSMLGGDYQKAKEIDTLQKQFQRSMTEAAKAEAYKKREQALMKNIDNAEHQLENLTASWEEKIASYASAEQSKLDKMGDKNAAALEKFSEKYESPESLREFSKASPALLQMRERERALLLASDFKEATAARAAAERMEEEEAARKQKVAEQEVALRRQNLLGKLQKELNVASSKASAKLKSMQVQKEAEEKALRLHIDNLKRELEQIRSGKGINTRFIVSDMQPLIPKMSQQQVKQLKSFRTESPAKRLLVRPNVYTAQTKTRRTPSRALPSFPE